MKKGIIISIVLVVVIIVGVFLIMTRQNNNQGNKDDITYEMYLKVNPLVLFDFKVENEEAVVTDFKLDNDKARELFVNIDFKGMNLITAIEIYGDKLKESKIEFTNIYIWTTWDNKQYFENSKYKLDVTIVKSEEIQNVPQNTIPKLQYDTKYYKVLDEHGFNIVFKENGVLEYHVDTPYSQKVCDEFVPSACFDFTFDDNYYKEEASSNMYVIEGDTVTLKAKEGEDYWGWTNSYAKCEILFNRIKCDVYNGFHDSNASYVRTEYYEIKK